MSEDVRFTRQRAAQILINRANADPGMPEKDWRNLVIELLDNLHVRQMRLEDGGLSPEETPTAPQRRLTPSPFANALEELTKAKEPRER
jgi:hypothetical protein